MYAEDVIVNYKGFLPTENTAASLKTITEHLHEESPSESSLKADFVKESADSYQGTIRINFSEGIFWARATSDDLNSVISELVQRLREQLRRWKTMRFEGEYSYDTSH
jgi:ribosome-associated translation inhibitor RaiA